MESPILKSLLKSQERQYRIVEKKNRDYSPGKDDYQNFRAVNYIMPWISVEEGILVRMIDKLQRAANVIHFGEAYVTEESVEDTLDDISNYSNIIIAYRSGEISEEEAKQQIEILSLK